MPEFLPSVGDLRKDACLANSVGIVLLWFWRGNAACGCQAEHLYHMVCRFGDGHRWWELLPCRIAPEGLAPDPAPSEGRSLLCQPTSCRGS